MLLEEYCLNNKKTIPGSLLLTYPDVVRATGGKTLEDSSVNYSL